MSNELEKLFTLLNRTLYNDCPILSGNMQVGIKITSIKDDEVKIVIDAPFYDRASWNSAHVLLLTGETINGKTDYAQWVNDMGAFGKHNKSQSWVNRTCFNVANIIAQEIGAEVINELKLY